MASAAAAAGAQQQSVSVRVPNVRQLCVCKSLFVQGSPAKFLNGIYHLRPPRSADPGSTRPMYFRKVGTVYLHS